MSAQTSGLFVKFGEKLCNLYPQFKKQQVIKKDPLLQTWYWQDGSLVKVITLQKSWMSTSFTIELSLDTKIENNNPHIGVIRERLPHLIYNQDFWWDYDKNDPQSVNKAVNEALTGIQNFATKWWDAHAKNVDNARRGYDLQQEKFVSDKKLETEAIEKAAGIITEEALKIFPDLKWWARDRKSNELLFYISFENRRIWVELLSYKDYEEANPLSLRLYIDLYLADKRPHFGGRMAGPAGLQPPRQKDQTATTESDNKNYVWKLDGNSDSVKQVVSQALTKTKEILPKLIETA